jgi:hypothetical protein
MNMTTYNELLVNTTTISQTNSTAINSPTNEITRRSTTVITQQQYQQKQHTNKRMIATAHRSKKEGNSHRTATTKHEEKTNVTMDGEYQMRVAFDTDIDHRRKKYVHVWEAVGINIW